MKKIFFTLVNNKYYRGAGTSKMINSFKYFHPDIDLLVYGEDTINKIFKEKNINFYMAKPTFAKLLSPYYDLVVNADVDHIFTARCHEILRGNFDIAAPLNYNDYENTSVENITEEMYLQGGLIASTNRLFWDRWEVANKDAMKYKCRENDIMNLVIFNDCKDMKLKILDKDKDYYGCKSLNREKEFYIEEDRVMCRKEQVFAYHAAKGGKHWPKLQFEKMGFTKEVVDHLNTICETV